MTTNFSPTGTKCEPVEKKVGRSVVRLQHGDLTALEVDAWVYYAKENLDIGSGYGTAITMRGGMEIKKELDAIGSVGMGCAVITSAGGMKAKHIVHACGPKFQEPDIPGKLAKCMASSLMVAGSQGVRTIAFPPMGCGFYGVPLDLSAQVMLEAIRNFPGSFEKVIICVIDHRDYVPFRKLLDTIQEA
jgi:O-acetyl-ADP-ribose deacetylase (regulator of RNase III)